MIRLPREGERFNSGSQAFASAFCRAASDLGMPLLGHWPASAVASRASAGSPSAWLKSSATKQSGWKPSP